MSNKTNKDEDPVADIQHVRPEPRPDFSEPLPRTRLPKEIQETLNNDEKLWGILTSGQGEDSTESSIRYAAYAARFRTILVSASRYVAYTSDIGESFRPVAHPWLVKGAYGVSWAYLIGDVAHEGYKARIRNENAVAQDPTPSPLEAPKTVAPIDHWGTVMAQRALFQGVASMGLPALTIHSIVRYSGRAMKNMKNVRIRTWGPIGLGLAAVPALPFMFDKPVEEATEWIFHKGFELVGGPAAVGHNGAQKLVNGEVGKSKDTNKEL